MRSKLIHATVSLVIFVGLSLVLVFLTAAGRSQPAETSTETHVHEHSEAGDGHGDHDGHDEHVAQEPMSLEALRAIQCEHDCPTIDCDECRYELGVARLDPDVAEGLVQTHRVESGPHVFCPKSS